MKIKKILIHNWRSIKDVEIEFQDLMVFIGQNNHGKSNVLSALLFFFGTVGCGDLDFNKGSDELFVEVIFSDLDTHDQSQFNKYLTLENTIKVRKEIRKGGTSEYHGYCQIPNDAWLKEENVSQYLARDAAMATPLASYIPSSGRITKEVIRTAQTEFIKNNQVTYNYDIESSPFLGVKNVAQGIFGEIFFVPAVKSANDEFNPKGKTIFNQLLTNVINSMSESNTGYIDVKQKVKELTETLNKRSADGTVNNSRPEQIAKLEELIETELASWNTTIDIEITPPDVDEIFKLGTCVWVDDGVSTDVTHKGNGLQRSLIFALVKAWAKVSSAPSSSTEEDGTTRRASKSTYFIFEETELYLHPQAQRELYYSLKKLSEVNNQVFISTHSSSFIDLTLYKSICIIYKNSVADGSKHLQCTSDIFSSLDDTKKFNITYWINPDRGELFFAKKIILLEGQTDKTIIPFLAEKLGVLRHDYTLIDCGGKSSMPVYINLLNNFKLPYIVVYDLDHHASRDANSIASCDMHSKKIEDEIVRSIGESVIFDNDIEEEIGILDTSKKNKPFLALEHVSSSSYVINPQLEIKVRKIYS